MLGLGVYVEVIFSINNTTTATENFSAAFWKFATFMQQFSNNFPCLHTSPFPFPKWFLLFLIIILLLHIDCMVYLVLVNAFRQYYKWRAKMGFKSNTPILILKIMVWDFPISLIRINWKEVVAVPSLELGGNLYKYNRCADVVGLSCKIWFESNYYHKNISIVHNAMIYVL